MIFSNKINLTFNTFSLYENIKVYCSLFRYSKNDCEKTIKQQRNYEMIKMEDDWIEKVCFSNTNNKLMNEMGYVNEETEKTQ